MSELLSFTFNALPTNGAKTRAKYEMMTAFNGHQDLDKAIKKINAFREKYPSISVREIRNRVFDEYASDKCLRFTLKGKIVNKEDVK